METTGQRSAPTILVVLVVLGFAMHWLWVDSLFFTPSYFGETLVRSGRLFFIVAQCSAILASLTFAFRPFPQQARITAMIACAASALLGICLFSIDNDAMRIIGGIALGITMGGVPVLWGEILVSVYERPTLLVCAAIAIAAPLTLAIKYVGFVLEVALIAAVPAIGCICYLTSVIFMKRTGESLDYSSCRPRGNLRDQIRDTATFAQFVWRFVFLLCCVGIAFGIFQTASSWTGSLRSGERDLIQILSRGIIAFVFAIALLFFKRAYRAAYRIGVLVMVAAFLASPLASESFPLMSVVLVFVGYSSVEVMAWTLSLESSRTLHVRPAFLIGVIRATMMSSVLLGIALVAVVLEPLGVSQDAWTTAIAYLLVLSMALLLDDQKAFGFWRVVDASSLDVPEIGIEQKCTAFAKSMGYTDREEEILLQIAQGRNARSIADKLYISANTVKYHLKNMYSKTGVHSKQELLDMVDSVDASGRNSQEFL